jgi:mannose-6-phosphate isomerase-like protein (cupin superfamily)
MSRPSETVPEIVNLPPITQTSMWTGSDERRTVGNYVRPLDDIVIEPDQYASTVLSQLDSALALRSTAPPGKAVPLHRHPVNQYMFVVEGELEVRFGSRAIRAKRNELVIIPAGMAHHSTNPTTEREVHLEFVAPNRSHWTEFIKPGEVVDEDAEPFPEGFSLLRREDESIRPPGPFPGFSRQVLLDRSTGGDFASFNIDRTQPGGRGPAMHIHRFDQYFLTLEGSLSMEIAGEEFVLAPGTWIPIPAGVPHRNWNASEAEEAHLVINCPGHLSSGGDHTKADISVDFRVTSS